MVTQPLRNTLQTRRAVGLVLGLAAIILACGLSVALGARSVGWSEIVAGVMHPDSADIGQMAVNQRIPRTIVGLVVGASLGLAGGVMQGVTRNPLADPGILGVNAGAAVATVLALAVFGITELTEYIWFAFLGAAAAAIIVYTVASLGREGATPLKLALAGAAVVAVSTSIINMILLTRNDVLDVYRFWQLGSLGRAELADLGVVAPFTLVGAVLAIGTARGLDGLAFGDEMAAGLGIQVTRTRVLGGIAAIVLAGAATALAGPIGFVGLTMAHLARLVTGPAYRWILPYAAAFGAVLVVIADVAGRVVARPALVEVGIMTAVVGAPVFVAIVRRQKVREL